jgi:hypothetical protein
MKEVEFEARVDLEGVSHLSHHPSQLTPRR